MSKQLSFGRRAGAYATLILVSAWSPAALAQDTKGKEAPKADQKAAPAPDAAKPPAGQPPQVVMPEAEKLVLLLRTSLLTLNDALQTGNFTVLRDMGAPGFREANSAARLSRIFGNLVQQGIDLSAVAVITPQLAEPPVLDAQSGMLRVKGTFPGQPVKIDFEVLYQPVAGRWRIFGLAVNPNTGAPAAADAAKQVPQPPAKATPASSPATTPGAKKAEPAKSEPAKK